MRSTSSDPTGRYIQDTWNIVSVLLPSKASRWSRGSAADETKWVKTSEGCLGEAASPEDDRPAHPPALHLWSLGQGGCAAVACSSRGEAKSRCCTHVGEMKGLADSSMTHSTPSAPTRAHTPPNQLLGGAGCQGTGSGQRSQPRPGGKCALGPGLGRGLERKVQISSGNGATKGTLKKF